MPPLSQEKIGLKKKQKKIFKKTKNKMMNEK